MGVVVDVDGEIATNYLHYMQEVGWLRIKMAYVNFVQIFMYLLEPGRIRSPQSVNSG